MNRDQVERFTEFLVIGVAMGVIEDLIAVKLATGEVIDMRMIGIVFLVAIPFAAFSEMVVDGEEFPLLTPLNEKLHELVN
jgi:hypothetical protein